MFSYGCIQLHQQRHDTAELVLPSEHGEGGEGEGVEGITSWMVIMMVLKSKLGKGACRREKRIGLMNWRFWKDGSIARIVLLEEVNYPYRGW